jgi:hypothetical protein
MKPLIIQFSPAYSYFLLGPNILLCALFLNILNLCSPLGWGDTTFHTYSKQKVQTAVFYIINEKDI